MKLFCLLSLINPNLILLLLAGFYFVAFGTQGTIKPIEKNIKRTNGIHHVSTNSKLIPPSGRRVSSGTVFGSMTVEAAMVVPLFIFCVLDLLFGIQVVETQSRINAALHETGSEICSYGYAVERGLGDAPSGILSEAYAIGSVAHHLGSGIDKRGGILGGRAGLIYGGT